MIRDQRDDVRRYYAASVLGLRALEQAEGRQRRFGAEADARWERFRGKLGEGDRLLMLIRDASAPWGVAFAASRVFQIPGVAADDPFGPHWNQVNDSEARRYLSTDETLTLEGCANTLQIDIRPVELPEIRPSSQLAVAGGAAILAVARHFQGRADLDWTRQVEVVADRPAHRQLAGLASLLVGAVRPCPVHSASGYTHSDERTVVVSADAETASAAALGA